MHRFQFCGEPTKVDSTHQISYYRKCNLHTQYTLVREPASLHISLLGRRKWDSYTYIRNTRIQERPSAERPTRGSYNASECWSENLTTLCASCCLWTRSKQRYCWWRSTAVAATCEATPLCGKTCVYSTNDFTPLYTRMYTPSLR